MFAKKRGIEKTSYLQSKILASFTLIEILVAFAVLVIITPLFLRTLPAGVESVRLSSYKTQAINLCQQKLEEYLMMSYTEIPTGTVEARDNLSDTNFTQFEREVSIKYVDGNLDESAADQGLKKILVTVWWRQGGKEHSENLVSLKAQP